MPSSLTPDQLQAMERNALLNAVGHGGTAAIGAVVSKSLGESPELRAMAKEVAKAAGEAVARVNSLSPEEQQKLLEDKFPDALRARDLKKAAQKADEKAHASQFPPLPNATKGRVVLRLPPEPSGYMTIGHAMAGVINSAYRDMYEGELWLRFEDTNPRKVKNEYYQSFRDGYTWVGIRWDHEKNVSADMEVLYYHARRLIEMGAAYACSCPADLVKKLRGEGKPCEHRLRSTEANVAVWDGMLSRKHKEGEWVIRLKGEMGDLDHSLRDPNILRVIDASHPVTGTKYVVWPVYDFEVVVEDKLCGVTHVLRSSEFHVALQDRIRGLLGFPGVVVEQFSRFNFKGTPVSKRLLRPLVEEKVVTGWDDPRMPTIEGVKRRGIVPEAIRQFTLQVGYGKTEHTYDWSLLFAVNRKILDPVSPRIFFAPDPLLLKVKGAPSRNLSLPFHPTYESLGKRDVAVSAGPGLWVPRADVAAMKEGEVFRLMDLYNVRLSKRGKVSHAEFVGDERMQELRKVQWVVDDSDKREVKVLEPSELFLEDETPNPDSLKVRKGFAEPAFADLAEGDIVQFPRYGFVRVDGPGRCVLAHP
ncbi:MAG TPA: glutamate--tRNA ligase [Nitrososphaerales archaeon]|nr:glutamate--tRNA ligase [Nitrososphaerales archaeon]